MYYMLRVHVVLRVQFQNFAPGGQMLSIKIQRERDG